MLAGVVIVALTGRLLSLDASGFSEDEAAKLHAIDAYRSGNFSANAEHPMLMKLAMWASMSLSDAWNAAVPSAPIAAETALRLPNVVAGSATVAAVYGLVRLLFGGPAAIAASVIVALDPNVTALNRIGKEETFLVLFLFVAMFCYEHAKAVGSTDVHRAQRWYRASGAAFGLMLASKYAPWLFGMYALFNVAAMPNPGANRPARLPYNGLIVAAFVAANFAVLLPDTWTYCLAYLRGEYTIHHGYTYAGALYNNSVGAMVHGVPATYYLRLIGTKAPLVVMGAALAGLVPIVRRHSDRGAVWLRVFLVMTLLSYSVMGSKFERYALPMLVVIDILAAVGVAAALEWISRAIPSRPVRVAVCAAGCAGILAALIGGQRSAFPFLSTFQNVAGRALAPPLATFPEEAYDFGVREAVADIAAAAAPGAAIVSDAPAAVEWYVRRSGRPDLEVQSLSADGVRPGGERWVIVQDGHVYFETQSLIAQVRQTSPPWREYQIRGTTVLQVFKVKT